MDLCKWNEFSVEVFEIYCLCGFLLLVRKNMRARNFLKENYSVMQTINLVRVVYAIAKFHCIVAPLES